MFSEQLWALSSLEFQGRENFIFKYWGKTSEDGQDRSYHCAAFHSLDVAAIAWRLMSPDSRRCKELSLQSKLSPELIQFVVTLTLLLHDLGKFSKSFQFLVPDLFRKLFSENKKKYSYSERHDTLGFILWREHIQSEIAQKNAPLSSLMDIIIRSGFGHHGIPPKESSRGGNAPLRASYFFDDEDCVAAKSFVTECLEILGIAPEMPSDFKIYKSHLKKISWQIAGVAVIADWIGSNSNFFPYRSDSMSLDKYWHNCALPRAKRALDSTGWCPSLAKTFTNVQSLFPSILVPTPLQELVAKMPLLPGPKLFIIEDVTGSGKTEAALILASRIISMHEADGFYIGLPTMATANAMYERMKDTYRRIYTDDAQPSLILSHGARHLSKKFIETILIHPQNVDACYGTEETASAICNEWYADNRKKALLADVGVGTIDQALLGILPARHQSLRLLGLQRKVLIVDEVHAYDPYMGHLLTVLLEAHARGGGSAILLSATIPLKKRAELVDAFRKGLDWQDTQKIQANDDSFPLVTQAGKEKIESTSVATRQTVCKAVSVSFVHQYDAVLQLIKEKTQAGQCVCWVRNTVKDARKAFYDLQQLGLPKERMDLFHSRFAMVDRNRIEEGVIANFGTKSGACERKGRILIATQVVEQSLDIDFDQMISDLAPIDLLIQRAGRLQRHTRDENGNQIRQHDLTDARKPPVLHIFAPKFNDNPDKKWLSDDFSGTAAVYQNVGILWLTQKILNIKNCWKMPEDARELIESVYGEGCCFDVPEGLLDKVCNAEGIDKSKESMGHLNALRLDQGYCRNAAQADQWDEDERISTRLSDENYEVILAICDKGNILPYAEVDRYAWDWSALSVSVRDWKKTEYSLPAESVVLVEELKHSNSRLKYCEIVIVNERSEKALSVGRSISKNYDPYLGWGAALTEEL